MKLAKNMQDVDEWLVGVLSDNLRSDFDLSSSSACFEEGVKTGKRLMAAELRSIINDLVCTERCRAGEEND